MICFLLLFCLTGVCLGLEVRQSHSDIFTKPGDKVQIFCSHDKTDYTQMFWYQRSPGDTTMKLIGYLNYGTATKEEPYKEHFNITGDLSGDKEKNGSLTVQITGPEHSAVYYCAASGDRDRIVYPAYFGEGTKLTVLEYDVKEPTVEVFRPSSKQCLNLKSEEKEKTLLCVASDFYPDHISVSWESGGVAVTTGVATDSFAAQDGKYYRISSRLRVNAEDWYEKEYECIVTFFNGTNYNIHKADIYGEEAPKDFHIREKYLRATQTAKLSYAVFIIKSSIYGAFVAFLVWKLKGSSGKQNG